MYKALALLAILPSTLAHFVLNYPTSLGFSDDDESSAPCGGFPITFNSNDTNVTVGGFAVASRTTHPQANWLFRATLSTQEPFNWTNILPVVSQSGLGDFCLPSLMVPESFIGQRGVIQVTQTAVDGNLYQCAAVNFIEGSASSVPSICTNATGVTATVTTETTLGSENGTATTSGSATSSAPAASSSAAAGVMNVAGGLLAVLPAGLLLL